MARKISHSAAFAHFGVVPRNVQWSWSARNEATKVVVVTLWQDEFQRVGPGLLYDRAGLAPSDLHKNLGYRELVENLAWARDNCDGDLSVIIAQAKNKFARPRSIAECHPSKLRARLVELDEATGAFKISAGLAPV